MRWAGGLAAGLAVAAGWYVARFGANAPWVDEWEQLRPLVGEAPVGPWLIEPHNEHRFPLPRLLWYGLHQFTGHDFRAGMWLSVVLLAAAGFVLMRVAARVRGRSHPADVLLPALLLHFGHHENLLIGYQIAFTLPVAVTAGILAVAGRSPTGPGPLGVAGCGIGVVLLGLCGGGGVVLSLPLAGWVGVASVRAGRGWRVVPLLALPAAAVGYAGWYVVASRGGANPADAAEKLRTAAQVLAGGLGPLGRWGWPVTGVVVPAGLLGASGLLARTWLRDRAERLRIEGLTAVLLGGVGVAAAIGVGRAGSFDAAGFAPRYAAFAAVPLLAGYFALLLYGPPRFSKLGHAAAVGLAAAVVASAVPSGLTYGGFVRFRQDALAREAAAGIDPDDLAARHVVPNFTSVDSPGTRAAFAAGLRVLERHRIGCYR